MSEDTNGGVGKLLYNNALIINEEIAHKKITGFTRIMYVKHFGNLIVKNWV
jgi:hypothetical protein